MWCGFEKSSVTIAAICMVTASVTISDTVFAASQVNYTPQQFRSVLRGLGYKVKVTNTPLTDDETKKAIQAFQKGYKLTADGIAGEKTQNLAGHIIQILQANVNVVLKPKSPLPRDQFYGPQTEAAVKEFQRKFQLKETGIADLTLRHKLNEEAKKKQRGYYSGKKKKHSNKTQFVADSKSKKIVCTAFAKGREHDFKLFKESRVRLHPSKKAQVDTGYQGMKKLHGNTDIPKKKSKKNPLNKEERKRNRKISSG